VAGLDYEEKGFLAAGTARLHTDCFAATLFYRFRIVTVKRAVAVRTAYFSHFFASLSIRRLGKQVECGVDYGDYEEGDEGVWQCSMVHVFVV